MTEQIVATAAENLIPVAAETLIPATAEAIAPVAGTALVKGAMPKIGKGEVIMLTFAGIGVIATGYFAFVGGKWVWKKVKSSIDAKKEAQKPEKAKEEPKADESTEE